MHNTALYLFQNTLFKCSIRIFIRVPERLSISKCLAHALAFFFSVALLAGADSADQSVPNAGGAAVRYSVLREACFCVHGMNDPFHDPENQLEKGTRVELHRDRNADRMGLAVVHVLSGKRQDDVCMMERWRLKAPKKPILKRK
jgi:hypothetical protein